MVCWLQWMCSFQQSSRNIVLNNIRFYSLLRFGAPICPTMLSNQPPFRSRVMSVSEWFSVCFHNLLIFMVWLKCNSLKPFVHSGVFWFSFRNWTILNLAEHWISSDTKTCCSLFALASHIHTGFIIYAHIHLNWEQHRESSGQWISVICDRKCSTDKPLFDGKNKSRFVVRLCTLVIRFIKYNRRLTCETNIWILHRCMHKHIEIVVKFMALI